MKIWLFFQSDPKSEVQGTSRKQRKKSHAPSDQTGMAVETAEWTLVNNEPAVCALS
jgi:hypothetical protein